MDYTCAVISLNFTGFMHVNKMMLGISLFAFFLTNFSFRKFFYFQPIFCNILLDIYVFCSMVINMYVVTCS